MTPRLSIVVPFYNVEHYFADCLDSLARQTFSDFEVILVDDGSRDGSVDIARSYCDLDNRFRIVTQENQGLGPARNTGVKHSQGEYLTFVDSDDLVTRHAYELMVNSLDRTSSDIAGGNARRFNNTNGVRQSYVHRVAYGATRSAVHVYSHRALAIDRMVWNKVYRRSFWDQFGYQFPAIRYEDYPVTLRAHIDAITVDCIAAPVYYWRERESGESITQQKFQFANLADRVTSAEMVLDLLDKRAPELRVPVHQHLAVVDLATIVQAFGSAADHEVPQLIELGQRLSRRLAPESLQAVSTFERLECVALQAGDVELLQRLARFRADGGLRGGYRARPHPILRWRYERQYPGLRDGSSIPTSLYRVSPQQLGLLTAVLRLDWDDDALIVRGTAQIAHLETPDSSTLHIELVAGGRTTALEVERFRYPDMRGEQSLVGFSARVPRALLAGLPEQAKMVFLSVELRQGRLRRKGTLSNPRAGSAQFACGARLGDVWVQPTRMNNGRLVLQRMRRVAEVTDATVDGGDLVLSGRIPADLVDPTLRLARAAGEVQVPLQLHPDGEMNGWTTRIPVATLVDAASPDDPFYGRTTRVPSIVSGDQKLLLLATGLDHAVMAPHGNRLVTVTRSPGAYMNIIESPLWVVTDRVETSGAGGSTVRLTVSGPRWAGVSYEAITWRRFLENSDDAVDVPCRVRLDDERWSADVDAAELLPPPGEDVEAPDWTLFAVADDSPYAVQTEAFLLTRLPVELDIDGRRIFLQPRAGTLHMKTG